MTNQPKRKPFQTLGTRLRQFGRDLRRTYTLSDSSTQDLPSPAWQQNVNTPLIWSDAGGEGESQDYADAPAEQAAPQPTQQRTRPRRAPSGDVQRQPAPPPPPQKPDPLGRTQQQITSDDERLANIMAFHRRRDERREEVRRKILQEKGGEQGTGPKPELTPSGRRRASFDYVETSVLQPDAPKTPNVSRQADTPADKPPSPPSSEIAQHDMPPNQSNLPAPDSASPPPNPSVEGDDREVPSWEVDLHDEVIPEGEIVDESYSADLQPNIAVPSSEDVQYDPAPPTPASSVNEDAPHAQNSIQRRTEMPSPAADYENYEDHDENTDFLDESATVSGYSEVAPPTASRQQIQRDYSHDSQSQRQPFNTEASSDAQEDADYPTFVENWQDAPQDDVPPPSPARDASPARDGDTAPVQRYAGNDGEYYDYADADVADFGKDEAEVATEFNNTPVESSAPVQRWVDAQDDMPEQTYLQNDTVDEADSFGTHEPPARPTHEPDIPSIPSPIQRNNADTMAFDPADDFTDEVGDGRPSASEVQRSASTNREANDFYGHDEFADADNDLPLSDAPPTNIQRAADEAPIRDASFVDDHDYTIDDHQTDVNTADAALPLQRQNTDDDHVDFDDYTYDDNDYGTDSDENNAPAYTPDVDTAVSFSPLQRQADYNDADFQDYADYTTHSAEDAPVSQSPTPDAAPPLQRQADDDDAGFGDYAPENADIGSDSATPSNATIQRQQYEDGTYEERDEAAFYNTEPPQSDESSSDVMSSSPEQIQRDFYADDAYTETSWQDDDTFDDVGDYQSRDESPTHNNAIQQAAYDEGWADDDYVQNGTNTDAPTPTWDVETSPQSVSSANSDTLQRQSQFDDEPYVVDGEWVTDSDHNDAHTDVPISSPDAIQRTPQIDDDSAYNDRYADEDGNAYSDGNTYGDVRDAGNPINDIDLHQALVNAGVMPPSPAAQPPSSSDNIQRKPTLQEEYEAIYGSDDYGDAGDNYDPYADEPAYDDPEYDDSETVHPNQPPHHTHTSSQPSDTIQRESWEGSTSAPVDHTVRGQWKAAPDHADYDSAADDEPVPADDENYTTPFDSLSEVENDDFVEGMPPSSYSVEINPPHRDSVQRSPDADPCQNDMPGTPANDVDLYQALVSAGVMPPAPPPQSQSSSSSSSERVQRKTTLEEEYEAVYGKPVDQINETQTGQADYVVSREVMRAPDMNSAASEITPETTSPSQQPTDAGVDVDKLARDVYKVLKDRLRIERERRNRR